LKVLSLSPSHFHKTEPIDKEDHDQGSADDSNASGPNSDEEEDDEDKEESGPKNEESKVEADLKEEEVSKYYEELQNDVAKDEEAKEELKPTGASENNYEKDFAEESS
jgi:hypothetical protein